MMNPGVCIQWSKTSGSPTFGGVKDETLAKRIAVLLARLRSEAGYAQEAFANAADVHRTYQTDVERAKVAVSVEIINRMCRTLGITLADFFARLEFVSESEFSSERKKIVRTAKTLKKPLPPRTNKKPARKPRSAATTKPKG